MKKPANITIALIEAYEHHEVLLGLCQLLDEPGICLEIVAAAQWQKEDPAYSSFHSASYRWHNLSTNWRRLSSPFPNLQHCDLIIIVTLGSPWQKWAKMDFSKPVLAIVHNSHDFFEAKKWQLPWSDFRFMDWLRWGNAQVRRSEFWKKRFQAKVSAFGFPEKRLFNYALENGWLSAQKSGIITPFASFLPANQAKYKPSLNEITIVIPGTVKHNGRDYALVQRSFSQIQRLINKTIHLVFLGSAQKQEAKDILKCFQTLGSSHFFLHFFENALPQELYDKWLSRADFLILPFKTESRFGLTREKMGISTISGAENDMLRFGIPALVAKTYPLPDHLQVLTQSFADERQLAQLLLEWIHENRFLDYRKLGKEALNGQQLSNLRQQFFAELYLTLSSFEHGKILQFLVLSGLTQNN
jgi:glycosyltransferase involved in cell wall biosynthesis